MHLIAWAASFDSNRRYHPEFTRSRPLILRHEWASVVVMDDGMMMLDHTTFRDSLVAVRVDRSTDVSIKSASSRIGHLQALALVVLTWQYNYEPTDLGD